MKAHQLSPTKDILPDFLGFVFRSVKDLFAFETNGHTRFLPEDIAAATLLMCAFATSAETIQMLDALPSADRILERLGEEQGLILGEKINQILKQRILKVPFPKGTLITVAGDITEDPFYGEKENSAVTGGKHKAGTHYFLKYLTFSIVVNGHRYPVGFYPITQLQIAILDELVANELQWLKEHDLCDRVLLDRGFNGQEYYNKLDHAGIKFLMPLTENQKLQRLFTASEPRITKHQQKHGFIFSDYHPDEWPKAVHVVAFWTKVRGAKNPDACRWLFFVTNLNLAPRTLWYLYKRRWGIETGYSQIHTLRAVTKSRNYGTRVFLTGLAFLLFATWIHLNWYLAHKSVSTAAKLPLQKSAIVISKYQITITLPQFRLLLALSVLARITQITNRNFDT